MKTKMNKKDEKILEVIETLGWWYTVDEKKEYIDIGQYSPAGEDFFFTVEINNLGQNIIDFCYGFDVDEHIEMWIEARRNGVSGVPSTRELVEDAESIAEMLNELATKVLEVM